MRRRALLLIAGEGAPERVGRPVVPTAHSPKAQRKQRARESLERRPPPQSLRDLLARPVDADGGGAGVRSSAGLRDSGAERDDARGPQGFRMAAAVAPPGPVAGLAAAGVFGAPRGLALLCWYRAETYRQATSAPSKGWNTPSLQLSPPRSALTVTNSSAL